MLLASNAVVFFLPEVVYRVEIRRLRQPVKNGDFIILESFLHEAKCVLGVIVLLDKPPNRHLLFRMGQHVCLQDVPVLGDVHNSLHANIQTKPKYGENAPKTLGNTRYWKITFHPRSSLNQVRKRYYVQ